MTLLENLWAHMGVAVLRAEHIDDMDPQSTTLTVLGTPPSWFDTLFPNINTEAIQWETLGAFLENFAIDAETLWNNPNNDPLYSGYWTMDTDTGESYHLEAIAVCVDDTALLLLENTPRHYDETQDILQRGRRMMLSYEKLAHQPYFDAVTGLYTLHGINSLANERWLNHSQNDTPLLIMHITIDNQRFLQSMSMDESALIETAHLIRGVFSPSDLAARMGDYDFKIILSDSEHAENATNEIKEYIQQRQENNHLYPLDLVLEISELTSESQLREVLSG